MSKGEGKNLSVEDLEHEKNFSEKAKISIVEAFIVVLIALIADVIEFFLPVVGLIVGIPVSIGIIFWAFWKGMYGRVAVKAGLKSAIKRSPKVLQIVGFSADALSTGFLPLRTLVLVITIFMNNHFEEETIKRITKVLEGHL